MPHRSSEVGHAATKAENQRKLEWLSSKLRNARDDLMLHRVGNGPVLEASTSFVSVDQSLRPDSVLLMKPRSEGRATHDEESHPQGEVPNTPEPPSEVNIYF